MDRRQFMITASRLGLGGSVIAWIQGISSSSNRAVFYAVTSDRPRSPHRYLAGH